MAKLNFNAWLDEVRGTFGRLVFKKQYGQMIVAKLPKPSTAEPTEAQLRQRELFTASSRFASDVFTDPVRRQVYIDEGRAKNTNPFTLAMADFLNFPGVKEVDLASYFGHVGDPIRIIAYDDGPVTVKVTIRDAAGATLESGQATNAGSNWLYTATTVAPTNQTLTIEAEATDRPGHQRALSQSWHA